jgi:hypothetical protein
MSEGVAEGYTRRSGLDEFCGISGTEHARLSGHVGEAFYTEAGADARGKERREKEREKKEKDLTQRKIRKEKSD